MWQGSPSFTTDRRRWLYALQRQERQSCMPQLEMLASRNIGAFWFTQRHVFSIFYGFMILYFLVDWFNKRISECIGQKEGQNNKTITDSNCRLVSNKWTDHKSMMANQLRKRNNLATLECINHQPKLKKSLDWSLGAREGKGWSGEEGRGRLSSLLHFTPSPP